jgi:hypothetical protein
MENYGEYILSILNKKRFVKQWLDGKYLEKPIIIYGESGIGKTSLVDYILKDFIKITIDIEFCRNNTSVEEYLEMSLYKKSITMMFDKNVRKKVLVFDDLKYIQTNDKNLFKQIINFAKKKTNFPVIYIFKNITHKAVQGIYRKCFPIHLSLTTNQIKTILQTYYSVEQMGVSLDQLIEKSSSNFHTIKINLDFYQTNTKRINTYDKKYDDLFDLIQEMYGCNSISDYYRISASDYTVISLHILENCVQWIFKDKKSSYQKKMRLLKSIYLTNTVGDNCYYKINQHNDWGIINHIITHTIAHPLQILSKNKIKMKDRVYNKYLSRSIIYTYNSKLLAMNGLTVHLLSEVYSLFRNKEYHRVGQIIHSYGISQKIFEKFSKYFFQETPKKEIQLLFKN